ncbi:DUF4870 domain-containing protein [Curtobacterium caseinilyticum]|uniref:DUF4870 domain-containing protein n=1 Tax=Curtobacterium caseinilyticum TaxID=3055137 RepID=A0ABT7TPX7_9MICO|nr:DUF4870 domain-containing protein [Curtobacterium caseinilyticum]MDM7891570.1 DUF4870 domain-containing protein [Curtobacterium caseinilyticum]
MSYGQQPGGPYGQQPGGPQNPQGPQYPAGYTPPQPMSPEDQRLWATLTHVGGIFFSLVVPIIAYLVLRDRGQFIKEHTRQALNFHITAAIAYVVAWLLCLVVIGFVLLPVIGVLVIVFAILAAVAANRGDFYRYPLTIEFIKQ